MHKNRHSGRTRALSHTANPLGGNIVIQPCALYGAPIRWTGGALMHTHRTRAREVMTNAHRDTPHGARARAPINNNIWS